MSSSSAISVTGVVGNFFTRNKLVNGSFDLWQRGLTFNAIVDGVTKANLYTADRWIALNGGGGVTVGRGDFARNQVTVPEYPSYYLSYQMKGITKSGTPAVLQKIEDVTKFAGKSVLFSFYANVSGVTFNPLAGGTSGVSSGYLPATIRCRQYLGSGGSGGNLTPDTISYTKGITLYANTWSRYSTSFSLNNLSGKTLGTVGTDFTSFEIRLPMVVSGGSAVSYLPNSTYGDPDVNTGFTSSNINGYTLGYSVYFANAQVDIGAATSYERRDVNTELEFAQKYYQKTFPYDVIPVNSSGITAGAITTQNSITASVAAISYDLKKKMRTTPSVTFYSISGNIGGWATAGATTGATGSVIASSSENLMIGSTFATVAAYSYIHLAADAEI
jgi:hypothetical protein